MAKESAVVAPICETEPMLLQHFLDMPSLVGLNYWQDATIGRTWFLSEANLSFVMQDNPTDLHLRSALLGSDCTRPAWLPANDPGNCSAKLSRIDSRT